MKRKLLLWDIDGTLVRTQGAGQRALSQALKIIFNIDSDLEFLDMAGRTDPYIFQEMFRALGITRTEQNFHDLLEAYFSCLPVEMAKAGGYTPPGILQILEVVRQRTDLAQGLLTGNLERGAKIKLVHFDLWRFFEFGAYGSDSSIRNELGPYALQRASKVHGVEFDRRNVFVIGDTPHDVACGKAIGARTIAVATGGATYEELLASEPTAALKDLGDTQAFLRIIDA